MVGRATCESVISQIHKVAFSHPKSPLPLLSHSQRMVDPQTIGVLPSSSPAESLYSDTYPDIVTDLFVPPNPLLLYLRLTPTH